MTEVVLLRRQLQGGRGRQKKARRRRLPKRCASGRCIDRPVVRFRPFHEPIGRPASNGSSVPSAEDSWHANAETRLSRAWSAVAESRRSLPHHVPDSSPASPQRSSASAPAGANGLAARRRLRPPGAPPVVAAAGSRPFADVIKDAREARRARLLAEGRQGLARASPEDFDKPFFLSPKLDRDRRAWLLGG